LRLCSRLCSAALPLYAVFLRGRLACPAAQAAADGVDELAERLEAFDADTEQERTALDATRSAQESARLDEQVGAGVGRIAVICPSPGRTEALLRQDPDLVAAMEAPGGDVLRSRLLVVDPVLSKGLEFDVVVLVDPAEIGERSAGDLYVAMTRPTRRLRVVSRLPLLRGLEPRSSGR